MTMFDDWFGFKHTPYCIAPLMFRWPKALRFLAAVRARHLAQTDPWVQTCESRVTGLRRKQPCPESSDIRDERQSDGTM